MVYDSKNHLLPRLIKYLTLLLYYKGQICKLRRQKPFPETLRPEIILTWDVYSERAWTYMEKARVSHLSARWHCLPQPLRTPPLGSFQPHSPPTVCPSTYVLYWFLSHLLKIRLGDPTLDF